MTTNTAQHTPGPWKAIQSGSGEWYIVSSEAPDAVTEARYTFLVDVRPQTGERYCHGSVRTAQASEAEANARLIASAPRIAAEHAELVRMLFKLYTAVTGVDQTIGQPDKWRKEVAAEARALLARIQEAE